LFIIIAVVVGALLIIKFSSSQISEGEKFIYNGYDFEKKIVPGTTIEAYYVTFYDSQGQLNNVPFHYSPYDVEDFIIDSSLRPALLKFIGTGTLYISVEPTANARFVQAGIELARVTGERMLGIPTRSALTEPLDGVFDVEIVYVNVTGEQQVYNKTLRTSQGIDIRSCEDAFDNVFVIQVKEMPRNYIAYSGHCATIGAQNADYALMLSDALVYRLLGVMEN